jgi:hypothetical protein
VVCLAQATYDNRTMPAGTLDPARLAVLADALEEAGCQDAEILGHLRGAGPHVRGCFLVDEDPHRLYQGSLVAGPHVRGCFLVDALLGKE